MVTLWVCRGAPYEAPAPDEPGRLGVFPSGSGEAAAARQTPHLDPTHPAFAPEHQAAGVLTAPGDRVVTTFAAVRGARKILVRHPRGWRGYADVLAADPRADLAVLKLAAALPGVMPLSTVEAEFRPGQAVRLRTQILDEGLRTVEARLAAPQETPDGGHWPTAQPGARAADGGAAFTASGAWAGLVQAGPRLAVVPWDEARRRILAVLLAGREVEYGFLGVIPEDLPPAALGGLGVTDGGAVRVAEEPLPGTPAGRGLLRKGDILLAVQGERVRTGAELIGVVGRRLAGAAVALDLIRDRRRLKVTVPALAKAAPPPGLIASHLPPPVQGLRVDYLTVLVGTGTAEAAERVAAALRQGGVVVRQVRPESPAARAGVHPGDFLTHVNGRPVETPAAFLQEMERCPEAPEVTLAPLEPGGPPRRVRLR